MQYRVLFDRLLSWAGQEAHCQCFSIKPLCSSGSPGLEDRSCHMQRGPVFSTVIIWIGSAANLVRLGLAVAQYNKTT